MSGHAYTLETPARRAAATRGGQPNALAPLAVALLCGLAMIVLYIAATQVGVIRIKDATALHDLTTLDRPRLESVGNFMLHMLEPLLVVIWGAALVLVALARSKPRVAIAVATVMSLAPLTAETLKPVLAHRHDSVDGTVIGPASWPSGHSTAALSVVLCAVLVAPKRWRPAVAAAGALYAAVIGFVLLVLAWHMPSDVLGGYLLATLWMALALAGVRLSERVWPPSTADAQV
jgi:membrane-associated phospholipid phosphatase